MIEILAAACAVATGWFVCGQSRAIPLRFSGSLTKTSAASAYLQQSAIEALGQRDGAIIVSDPNTRETLAIINPQLAATESLAPGSTIKPFVAVAALRANAIDRNLLIRCRGRYSRANYTTACSHQPNLPPLALSEALAYSCNYYFATLGERIDQRTLTNTLSGFHLVGTEILQTQPLHDPRVVLGESESVRTTPLQLLEAYTLLLSHRESLPFRVSDDDLQTVINGLRGSVQFGTAANAQLDSLPIRILGKTGTSTPARGYGSQGWFVGFASSDNSQRAYDLAVLVFLRKGNGAEAATVSRTIFDAFGAHHATSRKMNNSKAPATFERGPASVRVHIGSENTTRQIPLEDYVAAVVALEGSLENQPEALKALAIAVRTYALKNLNRHAADGYDFCDLTHCQRFRFAALKSRQSYSGSFEAARATRGNVLVDEHSQFADTYFSASCGGITANVATLWGGVNTSYPSAVRDEYCATMPHHAWTDTISSTQLLKALRSDARSDPGNQLKDLTVTQYDVTGRAELISITGETVRTISGWDLKIIVGRSLGWNHLKSSRFTISRVESNYVFSGSGFGHGLGLCQEGAHVMAQRGMSYEQILAKYFPETQIVTR